MLCRDYFKFMAHLGPNFQINSGFVVLSLRSYNGNIQASKYFLGGVHEGVNLGYRILVFRVNLGYWVLVLRVNLGYQVLVLRVNSEYRVLERLCEKFSRCPRWSLA